MKFLTIFDFYFTDEFISFLILVLKLVQFLSDSLK